MFKLNKIKSFYIHLINIIIKYEKDSNIINIITI